MKWIIACLVVLVAGCLDAGPASMAAPDAPEDDPSGGIPGEDAGRGDEEPSGDEEPGDEEPSEDEERLDDAQGEAGNASGTGPRRSETPFGWAAGAGGPQTPVCFFCANGASAEVADDAVRMEITIEWTCSTPGCQVEAAAYPPGRSDYLENHLEDGAAWREVGDGTLATTIEAPEAGEWWIPVNPYGATGTVEGVVTVVKHHA